MSENNTIETNKKTMKLFLEFINTRNEDIGNKIVSPDAIFYVPGKPVPMKGPQGYIQIIDMMRNSFPDIQWKVEDLVAEDNNIAARFTMTGTHKGEFMGKPATGKPIKVQAMNLYRFSNGLLVEEYGQPDFLALLMQIDAIPIL